MTSLNPWFNSLFKIYCIFKQIFIFFWQSFFIHKKTNKFVFINELVINSRIIKPILVTMANLLRFLTPIQHCHKLMIVQVQLKSLISFWFVNLECLKHFMPRNWLPDCHFKGSKPSTFYTWNLINKNISTLKTPLVDS